MREGRERQKEEKQQRKSESSIVIPLTPITLECIMIHLCNELGECCVSEMVKKLHSDKRSRKMMACVVCKCLIIIICKGHWI